MWRLGWLVLVLGLGAAVADAQVVRVGGAVDHPAAAVLREVVERGDYQVLARDTLLSDAYRLDGDLIVVDAAVRLAGTVEGAVVLLSGARLFARSGARIRGPVVVAGGSYFASGLAEAGEVLTIPAGVEVEVVAADGEYQVVLVGPPSPSPLVLPGLKGLLPATYDRVNGLTVRAGAGLLLSDDRAGARARGRLWYSTARGRLGGAAGVEAPLGDGVWASAELARRIVTNEEWIRGDLENSLAALVAASDVRNYHESDEFVLAVARRREIQLIQGESFIGPWLAVRAARDRSLAASDPWALFGDEWRPNPPIAEGTLLSLLTGADVGWVGASTAFEGDVLLEWAPGQAGDFEFARLALEGRWSMFALWGHRIEVYARTLQPLGSDSVPPQRWSFVGGPGTLPTLEIGALRGDHLVFVESSYSAPLRSLVLPLVGPPELLLAHAVGSAWVTGTESPRWEQNLGVGLGAALASATVYVNPAGEAFEPQLSVSLRLPF